MTQCPRFAMLLLLACLVPLCATRMAGSDATPQAWAMPMADRLAIHAVVERAISVGLPDAKGGTLYQGVLTLTAAQDRGPFAPNQDHTTLDREYTYNGLHLKLADGTWVVDLTWPLAGAHDVTVDATSVHELPIDQLMAQAEIESTKNPDRYLNGCEADDLITHYAADQRPIISALRHLNAIFTLIKNEGRECTQIAHLIRLGVPHTELLAALCASPVMSQDGEMTLCAGAATPLGLLPANGTAAFLARLLRFKDATDLRLPDLATTLRRALALHFYRRLMDGVPEPFPKSPLSTEISAVEGLCDADAMPALHVELTRLIERAALPATAKADADLTARLAAWNGGARDNFELMRSQAITRTDDQSDDGPTPERSVDRLAELDSSEHDLYFTLHKIREFTESEMGGLVSLAGDRKASIWLDQLWCRTIGDNALRALYQIIGCDPRILVGRDPAAPWTGRERDATASALGHWWQVNQGKPLSALIAANFMSVSLLDLARVINRADARQRTDLLAMAVHAWTRAPPKDPDAHALVQILVMGNGDAALAKVVSTWPSAGTSAALLAAWHLLHHDDQPFDTLLASELTRTGHVTATATPGDRDDLLAALILIAYHHPNPERMQRILAILEGPLDTAGGHALLHAIERADANGYSCDLDLLWSHHRWDGIQQTSKNAHANQEIEATTALPQVIFSILLRDQRPVPAWLAEEFAESRTNVLGFLYNGIPVSLPMQAKDLRINDYAALMASCGYDQLLRPMLADAAQLGIPERISSSFDLSVPMAERDCQINQLRHELAQRLPMSLAAAGLPATVPGLIDARTHGDAKAAF